MEVKNLSRKRPRGVAVGLRSLLERKGGKRKVQFVVLLIEKVWLDVMSDDGTWWSCRKGFM